MNIKILDSWLKEYLKTNASPQEIAKQLSLTSVSIERVEPYKKDFTYDIEVTTNRPDLASVVGLAREASAVLPQFGIEAKFVPPELPKPQTITTPTKKAPLKVHIKPELVNRICAVVMDVTIKDTSELIKDRLESTEIRSLNNVIDITNYVMRTLGFPTHVMDYDRLDSTDLFIREAKEGETINTLDDKEYTLKGGEIVADNGKGVIVDLLGIMGLSNSVVTKDTKRIVYFINNDNADLIRKASMNLGIRTDAAQLNEKDLDPELAYDALLYGISLFKRYANAQIVSEIIDIYPNKPKKKKITVTHQKITTLIGVDIPLKKSSRILTDLGFETKVIGNKLEVTIPSFRDKDMNIPEDVIEELARVYGYHNIPTKLPMFETQETHRLGESEFFWEKRIKEALKYWGFTEMYTYSFVSEELYDGPAQGAVTVANPLTEDFVYMRNTLIPSLLQVVAENKNRERLSIFEVANIYIKKDQGLPDEHRVVSAVIKKPKASFFEVKGIVEQIMLDIGIKKVTFKPSSKGDGAEVFIGKDIVGQIELLEENVIDFELRFDMLYKYATLKKTYTPMSKFPGVYEDLAIVANEHILTAELIEIIQKQSPLIKEVSLLDQYENTRTFHIVYQHTEKNLTNEEVGEIREKILAALNDEFGAKLKE